MQVCEDCTLCTLSTHFRKAQCTTTQQTQCQLLTVCKSDEFQTRASSLTQDRLCQAATKCVAGQEEVNPLTTTSDRSCRVCPAGKTDADSNPSTPCVACGAGHYVPEDSTGSCDTLKCAAGSSDADSDSTTACVECDGVTEYTNAAGSAGACAAMTDCNAGEEVVSAGSSSTDRTCRACVDAVSFSDGVNEVSLGLLLEARAFTNYSDGVRNVPHALPALMVGLQPPLALWNRTRSAPAAHSAITRCRRH